MLRPEETLICINSISPEMQLKVAGQYKLEKNPSLHQKNMKTVKKKTPGTFSLSGLKSRLKIPFLESMHGLVFQADFRGQHPHLA